MEKGRISLENILRYLKKTEEKHYKECSKEERKNHIYKSVLDFKKWVDEEIKDSEKYLKDLGVNYEHILHNNHDLIDEDSENANFEAGKLSVLYELKKIKK